MSETVDVVIIGAGPYGLSLAAHLRGTGLRYRQFGRTMALWRDSMPHGMFLKSQGFASNLSDPYGTHTLAKFCELTGRDYADYGVPVSLDTYIEYGSWFQRNLAPDVEEVFVENVTRPGRDYEVTLTTGEVVSTRAVVVATGVEHFARTPMQLSALPAELNTHTSAHGDLSRFAGREVAVLGAGQSAMETAALLHEGGARVQLIVRSDKLVWNGLPLLPERPLWRRVREPEAGLGSGLSTWFYSTQPDVFRRLPANVRCHRARTALGPAGAWWLRERVEDRVTQRLGHRVEHATPEQGRVRLSLRSRDNHQGIVVDHVISGTGFPPNLARLSFLDERLRARVRTEDRAPMVNANYQSSVPGLFFIGPAVTPTFGPVMRFVYGADHAVRRATRGLLSSVHADAYAVAGAGR